MALSATSGPMPVTSPSVMPIQPVIKGGSCWLSRLRFASPRPVVERKNVPGSQRNLEQADERFLFQLLNPLLFELFLRLRAEGQLHVITHFVERFDVRGARALRSFGWAQSCRWWRPGCGWNRARP